MNTLEAIKKRVSCRAYKPEQISEEALNEILKAGMSAPVASAMYDSMHITVVQNEEVLKQIVDLSSEFLSNFTGQNADMMAQLGIPVGLKPLLCASFGYAVKDEPAKEHRITVNRV